jgi:hypothetical protein
MTDEQIADWSYKMQIACNKSTSDSDINIIKLIQHIENLYKQGRADEREACAKLCEEVGDKAKDNDGYTIGGYACAKAIRERGNHEQN